MNASNGSHGNGSQYSGAIASPAVQALLTYSIPVVALLGLFGNSVAFVLLKNSALRSTAHFYLCALTVCDSLTLLSILASVWAGALLSGHLHHLGWRSAWLSVGLRGIHLCRARIYLSFVCRTVSTWTVAAFSWERCLAVWRPMRFEGSQAWWHSALVLAGLVAAAAGVNAYVIPGYQPDARGVCRPGRLFRLGRNFSMLLHSLVPWLAVLASNCLIVCSLRRRQRGSVLMRRQQRHLCQRRTVAYRLIVVSFSFLATTSLLTVFTVWMTVAELAEVSVGEGRNRFLDTVWLASFLPFTVNFASSCPLYCLVGRKFRRAAWLLVTCRLEEMRQARALLDPTRPSSGLTGAAAAAACAGVPAPLQYSVGTAAAAQGGGPRFQSDPGLLVWAGSDSQRSGKLPERPRSQEQQLQSLLLTRQLREQQQQQLLRIRQQAETAQVQRQVSIYDDVEDEGL